MKKAILTLILDNSKLVNKNQERSIAMKRNKSKKVKIINEKTMIVALDIGKGVHHAYFRAPNGKDIEPFQFFKSTGPYAEPLFHYLRKKPVELVQINPMHGKRIKELTGNSPNKNDKKDPRVIADVICLGHALTVVVPEGPAAELRRLTQARERAVDSLTVVSNQLQQLLFVIFPEFLNVMKNTSTKSAIYLIKNHPAPEDIVAMGLESLTMVLKKISRARLGLERAKELFEAAQHSIGIYEGKKSILLEIGHLVSEIENKSRYIQNLEKQMDYSLGQIPYSRYILSIKGIGRVIVAGLIGEVGDFKKFNTISEIMKLAGLDLYEVSSGNHQGQRHISKRGRSLMRKLLYFAAMNAVKTNGIMHEQYHQMLGRGMLKMKALIAISRKLLALIFALVRDNTEYMKNYNEIRYLKLAA
jgi:transposase